MKRSSMIAILLIIGVVCLGAAMYLYLQKPGVATYPNESKEKGNQFEDYTIQTIVHSSADIKLLGKNADYHSNGVSATENTQPDLRMSYQGNAFAVECKWRAKAIDGSIIWAKDYQIKTYRRYAFEQNVPVFVAIGIGGTASRPNNFYLVPLYRLTKEYASMGYIEEFRINEASEIVKFLEKHTQNMSANMQETR